MSRCGYSDDLDALDLGRWRGQVASAIQGKRGQRFFSCSGGRTSAPFFLPENTERKFVASNASTPCVCGCDDSAAWKARALKAEARANEAEARVVAARVWLRGLLEQVDATLGLIDGSETGDAG